MRLNIRGISALLSIYPEVVFRAVNPFGVYINVPFKCGDVETTVWRFASFSTAAIYAALGRAEQYGECVRDLDGIGWGDLGSALKLFVEVARSRFREPDVLPVRQMLLHVFEGSHIYGEVVSEAARHICRGCTVSIVPVEAQYGDAIAIRGKVPTAGRYTVIVGSPEDPTEGEITAKGQNVGGVREFVTRLSNVLYRVAGIIPSVDIAIELVRLVEGPAEAESLW